MASSATSRSKTDAHALALQIGGTLGGLDVLVNNASSLGPVPLALLGDTECEDFEAALQTNLLGPFRLTKALLGLLAVIGARGRARGTLARRQHHERCGGVGLSGLGRLRRQQGGLAAPEPHLERGVARPRCRVLAVDPGDMDTPLHAAALPDADPATLKRPRDAAREIVALIDRERLHRRQGARHESRAHGRAAPARRAPAACRHGWPDLAPRADSISSICSRAGDVLVANDAATMPASLAGVHRRSGATIELRLASRRSVAVDDVHRFAAVVFGAGDFRWRTEDRPPPPPLAPGDRLALGPLEATVLRSLGHPRLVEIAFAGPPDAIWAGLARHGRPVQYAHLAEPLALWDVWTRVAALPVAFEPPSAGFVLDWHLLDLLRARGVGFATLTHAAGLSSTGDAALDARLPLDEPYHLPAATIAAIESARSRGGRVVALGTTVARALEHAAARPGGPATRRRSGDEPARSGVAPAGLRRAAQRHPRARLEPSRAAARLRRRHDARAASMTRSNRAATAPTSSATRSSPSARLRCART